MRLDVIKLGCPECKVTLEVAGPRIPQHFLDAQIEGCLVEYNGASQIMALAFRRPCRLSGAKIEALIAAGGVEVLP